MDELTSVESWMPIPGFSGYQVSDHGRVWSHYRGGRTLKPFPARDGYPQVQLISDAGAKVTLKLHRLVLMVFVGPAPMGMEACHEDDDHLNARLSNLRWGTRSANMADRARNGGATRGRGSGLTPIELSLDRRRALRAVQAVAPMADDPALRSPINPVE